jgi:site-specific recombinase XerD
MNAKHYIPIPVFDTLEEIIAQYKTVHDAENPQSIIRQWLKHCFADISVPSYAAKDYQWVLNFLYSYRGSTDTFVAYRRDIERLLQWSWFVRDQSLLKHKREDIEAFIEFCLKPPKRWIGLKTVARFKRVSGEKQANPQWRPFDAHVNKQEHKAGIEPKKDTYRFSQQSLKVMFAVLGSFYNYLLQEETVSANPVALIRQKSKFIRKEISTPTIRRLSDEQWQTVLMLAKEKAKQDPKQERTVFILSCLYGMYLRISELVTHTRWTPTMGDFFKDSESNWWFKTVGKGNKARQVAVSRAMLEALKAYRVNLGLTPYPTLGEKTPLISHVNNYQKAITHTRPIRYLVQTCFDEAAAYLEARDEPHEAASLRVATVHWLRHTGISEDVKHRPREHVRDDAGHSSGAITDKYIDVNLRDRAKSAKGKQL